MTDWQSLITPFDKASVHQPIDNDDLETLREHAGVPLPNAYEDFLRFSNGLTVYSDVIWTSDRVMERSEEFATEDWEDSFMSFRSMFVFGGDANGDYFFFPKLLNDIEERVYVWRHEDDSRIHVSYSLEEFLQKYLSGDYDAWKL